MITVKQLKDYLNTLPQDAYVYNEVYTGKGIERYDMKIPLQPPIPEKQRNGSAYYVRVSFVDKCLAHIPQLVRDVEIDQGAYDKGCQACLSGESEKNNPYFSQDVKSYKSRLAWFEGWTKADQTRKEFDSIINEQ